MTGIIVFIISLLVYLLTLCPVVYVGDSGNFSAGAFILGIGHPPGYPLYMLLGHIFTFLPLDNIAYRVNLMSAFFASAAVLSVFILLKKMLHSLYLGRREAPACKDGDERRNKISFSSQRRYPACEGREIQETLSGFSLKIIALSASLVFAFSRTFWSQAVSAEVYTLNAFFVALTLYLLILGEEKKSWWFLLSLVYGISLANHDTMLLLGPVYAAYVLWINRRRKDLTTGDFTRIFVLFCLGLLIYLYLPLRSLAHTSLNWGNPENFANLWAHVTRKQYGPLSPQPHAWPLFFRQLSYYLNELSLQFSPPLLVFAVLGLFFSIKAPKIFLPRIFALPVASYLMLSIGFIYLLNIKLTSEMFDLFEVFAIPSYMVAVLWFGFGLAGLIRKKGRMVLLALFLPAAPLFTNFHADDRSNHYVAYDYGRNILKTPDGKAYIFTTKDNQVFPLCYFKKAEKMRPDIVIADDYGYVFQEIYGPDFGVLEERERNIRRMETVKNLLKTDTDAIYCTPGSAMSIMSGVEIVPVGLLRRVVRSGESVNDSSVWNRYQFRDMGKYNLVQDYATRHLVSHYHYNRGVYFHRKSQTPAALEEYRRALEVGYDMEYTFNNIGVAFGQLHQHDESIRAFRQAVAINPKTAEIHGNLGIVLIEKGTIDEAIAEFRAAIALKSFYPACYYYLGQCLEKKGLPAEAEDYYREAITQDPHYLEAGEALKRVSKTGVDKQ